MSAMDMLLGALWFYGSLVLGLSVLLYGCRLALRSRDKKRLTGAALAVLGFVAMCVSPIFNMVVFRPFAPHEYSEKIGDNEKYIGKGVDLLVMEKGNPLRITSKNSEELWYYNVNKPFFVFEFDELEFRVKDKQVLGVRIDFF